MVLSEMAILQQMTSFVCRVLFVFHVTSSSDSGALKNEYIALIDTILTSKQDARMSKLLNVLFGCCTHDRYSFPISARPGQRRSEAARMTGMYVVCLNRGREFAYSWDKMKVVSANPVSAAVAESSLAASTWEHRAARLRTY